ncbi:MAG: hypothetical protein JRC87_01750 [Deltaproteobacteria bacterium]|nr:hypothetical protein [Deltaproteobacteria bacterium]MBW2658314.1 hypothetical protein [Deltaproteobacteria bacterium]
MRLFFYNGIGGILILFILSGCAGLPGNQVGEQVAPMVPGHELVDSELLNVSIRIFHPGELPQNPDERRGLSPEIREAESRFAPIHLKHTLQRTGYWGAVRVVPGDDVGAEVYVRGKIELSDGESAVLNVEVTDARNVLWFRRLYAETARSEEYYNTEPERKDAFQDLFNTIANDLAQYRNSLSRLDIEEIRNVAAIRYGYSMAPDALDNYLGMTGDGRVFVQRLPSRDDPMMERVEMVKARDDMLVDAINDYYDIYYHDLWQPYLNWRKFRQEEVSTLRKLERQALAKQLIGITSIVGAIALGIGGNYETAVRTQPLQQLMIAGGSYSLYSGFQTREESRINKDAIEELDTSFSAEAEPLVIEVDGKTIRLTGSAEQQYSKWRSMLKQIYARETGLLPTVDSGSTSAPAAKYPQP